MTGYPAERITAARTFLFVPGDRPERFAKAAAAGADIVVIDLEDAVAPDAKPAARGHAADWLAAGKPAMIRINSAETRWYADDLEIVNEHRAAVMVPKFDATIRADCAGPVVPLVETAAGVLDARRIAGGPGVLRLAFGSIDLAAQLGVDPEDREALSSARSALVLASAAAGVAAPVDGVTTALDDPAVVAADFGYARRLGMTAKLCIHPSQVAAVHGAARPSDDQISWAHDVLAAGDGRGAVAVGGQMVDPPVLHRARAVLAAAARC